MATLASAYLVVRRDDGFGDVFPLVRGQRYTLGRATTSRVVLKDDLCSREHAEVAEVDGHWRLRDLSSLNGTRLNGIRIEREEDLAPGDDVGVGHTRFLFVEDMGQLPDLPIAASSDHDLSIKKRLGQTRFLTPLPPIADNDTPDDKTPAPGQRHNLSRELRCSIASRSTWAR